MSVRSVLLLVELLPATTNCAAQFLGVGNVSGCKVAGSDLGVHLDLGIWGDQVVWNRNTLQDLFFGGKNTLKSSSMVNFGSQLQQQATMRHSQSLLLKRRKGNKKEDEEN